MSVTFVDLTKGAETKAAREKRIQKAIILHLTALGSTGASTDAERHETVSRRFNETAAVSRTVGEAEIAFRKEGGQPEAATFGKLELGIAQDFIQTTELGIALKTADGETVATHLPPRAALGLAQWLINEVWALSDFKVLDASERRELRDQCDHFARFLLDIDGTSKRISGELQHGYQRAYDARHFSSLEGLERKAEDAAERKYSSAIRDLAEAATATDRTEKAVLLSRADWAIKKAFGHD